MQRLKNVDLPTFGRPTMATTGLAIVLLRLFPFRSVRHAPEGSGGSAELLAQLGGLGLEKTVERVLGRVQVDGYLGVAAGVRMLGGHLLFPGLVNGLEGQLLGPQAENQASRAN